MPARKKAPSINEAAEVEISGSDLPFEGDPSAPKLFASSVRVIVSTFDFALALGQFELTEDGSPRMRQVGTIFLSPGHAKALADLLTQRVAMYEEQFGELPRIQR